ncbi:MAG: type I restriction enzyme HsdR N-terminal domain-containing protein, partial [Dolichospermum sp.]
MKIKPFYRVDPKDWLLTTNKDVINAQKRAIENCHLTENEIEEYVRQWVLRELITTYNYPQDWLGERIIVEQTVQMATMEKEADISIKNDRGRTFLYIETKVSGISDTEFSKAERQLEGYLSSTHTATVGMVTDGTPRHTKVI